MRLRTGRFLFPSPLTLIVLVNTGLPEQVAPEKTANVMVPVGLNPVDSWAVSEDVPAVVVRVIVEGETWVVMLGLAESTVSVSALVPHGAVNGLLLESPEYDATQL